MTLQLGPLWVVSAVLGSSRFDEFERQAFRAQRRGGTGRKAGRCRGHIDASFDRLVRDNRSIVSGLGQVTALLERVEAETSRLTREAMLLVRAGVARARGPLGRRILEQDPQPLALVAYVLETPIETAEGRSLDVGALV